MQSPGLAFTFRWYPRWQFWRRRTGVGRLVALDESIGIAHIAVLGFGVEGKISHIQHMPVLASRLSQSVMAIAESPEFDQREVWAQVQSWRAAHAAHEAGAFTTGVGEAVELIEQVVRDDPGPHLVQTAYPIRDSTGSFRNVRVVVGSGRQATGNRQQT